MLNDTIMLLLSPGEKAGDIDKRYDGYIEVVAELYKVNGLLGCANIEAPR